jgi:nucleoside-diphosphate-sugar epimerase
VAEGLRRQAVPIIVTGGGGWLGRAALDMLATVFGDRLDRRVAVFGSGDKTLDLRPGLAIRSRPLADLDRVELKAPLILHFAYLTRGYADLMPRPEYIAANRAITAQVVAYAERMGASGIFLPSSGAVYRRDRSIESDLERNPYGVLKREDEMRIAALPCPSVIFRIFNLAGPFMNHADHYALGSILGRIERGEPILIKAAHPVIRGFTHVGDVLNLALALLLDGQGTDPIDTLGRPAIEIGALARLAAEAMGRPDLPILRPEVDPAIPDSYLGDGTRFEALAHAEGLTLRDLPTQIRDTATDLRGRA